MLPLIIVFAKAPVAHRVKTRLIPRISATAACRLHRAFVEDTLQALEKLPGPCDIELHADALLPDWLPCPVVKPQSQGNLGTRMFTALADALNQGRRTAMILGSDSPTLPSSYIADILDAETDVCLGPASDGGFYAIGCHRTASTMFDGVEWSTPDTLQQTLRSIEQSGLTWSIGKEWYDVDTGEDLDRLIADPALRRATRNALCAENLF